MSDILISYKREDRPRAKQLAGRLREHGFSVWWDRRILPGKSFDEVIREALDRASCVIVLWSEKSVRSDRVKEEAAEGAERDILVPVLIEEVDIPLGFGRIQTANLVGWRGETSHPEFEQLVSSINVMLGRAVETSRTFAGRLADVAISRTPPRAEARSRDAGAADAVRRGIAGWVRAAIWAGVALVSAAVGAGAVYYVSEGGAPADTAGTEVPAPAAEVLAEVPGDAESSPGAAQEVTGEVPAGEIGVAGPPAAAAEPDAAGAPATASPAGEPPAAADPAAAAYRKLAELRGAPGAGASEAELLRGYEELWSEHGQALDAADAAEALRTLESLRPSREALESFESLDRRDDLTVLERLSSWRKLAVAYAGTGAGERAAARVAELEEIARSSATILAEDRFVTCERVARGQTAPARPIGVREDFRRGTVNVFAWVNSPRPRENLRLEWRDGSGVTGAKTVTVGRNTAAGYRIFYSKSHRDAGRYEVRLYNEVGELIGRRAFTVG